MSQQDLSKLVKDCVIEVHTVLRDNHTIEEAIHSLKQRKVDEKIFYFYVVDDADRLQGVISTRTLLLQSPLTRLCDVMEKKVVSLNQNQTLKQAMELLSSHQLLAVPVVDEEKRFKGMIDVQLYLEEKLDVARTRQSNDVFQILGMTLEEGKNRTPWSGYKIRMPWIFCNMIGGFGCAIISRVFELVLGQVLVLAMFIPLVLTLSESISMQSMTQTLQMLRKERLSLRHMLHLVGMEWRIITLLSLTCGVVVGVMSLFWGSGLAPSMTISVGIVISIIVSATLGASIPLLLHARRLDPKVASGPVVLMFADIITTAIYLGLATMFLL